jgi:hypothetical protein
MLELNSTSRVRMASAGMLLAVLMLTGTACAPGGGSGSSAQPICDGTGDAGAVGVAFVPRSCDAVVDPATDCPAPMICQIVVSNGSVNDIDIAMVSGSASVPSFTFSMPGMVNMVPVDMIVDVDYVCGAGIDESGVIEVDVSLSGAPGAFCGRDANWSVDLSNVP